MSEYPKKVLFFDIHDDKYMKLVWDLKQFDMRICDTSDKDAVVAEYNNVLNEYAPIRPKMFALKKNIPQQLSGKILAITIEELCNMVDPENF